MTSAHKTFVKDPDAVLDYTEDWSEWMVSGDSIVSSSWTVPTGITKDSDAFTGTETVVWLSGGTVGQVYQLTNHIVTADGREDDRTIAIRIKEL